MTKKLVIAGNRSEALYWAKQDCERRVQSGETTVSLSEYILAPDVSSIRGIRNPHGVFVGRWKERHDIKDIITQLFFQTDQTEPQSKIFIEMLKTL